MHVLIQNQYHINHKHSHSDCPVIGDQYHYKWYYKELYAKKKLINHKVNIIPLILPLVYQ